MRSNAGNGAFTQLKSVVLNKFIHGLGKGLVSTKVGCCALERERAAMVADLGILREGTDSFCAFAVLGLIDADVAEGAVPAEFFSFAPYTAGFFALLRGFFDLVLCPRLQRIASGAPHHLYGVHLKVLGVRSEILAKKGELGELG